MKSYTEESYKYEKNKHIAELEINFLKEYKESEAVKKLLLAALEVLKQNTMITIIETGSTFLRVWDFWEKLGAELAHEEGVNRLYLDEVNWDLMNEWVKEGRIRGQEEEIEILAFKECPDEIIEEYTELVTEIMNFVPFGGRAHTPSVQTPKTQREGEEKQKEGGFGWRILVTKEKDGTLSGTTEVIYSPDSPHWVVQDLTGVRPEYRGRGLGKWMKAEMLFYIKENLPETIFIQTGNAEFNAPMMSINKRMGFKRHLSEKCYKIKLEELEKKLAN